MKGTTEAQKRPTLPLFVALSRAAQWKRQTNEHFADQSEERLKRLEEYLPHGSSICKVNRASSTDAKLVIETSYHHMNDGGRYDGWTDHTIVIKPSLTSGFDMTIGGRDRNDIKDYLGELFDEVLRRIVDEYPEV